MSAASNHTPLNFNDLLNNYAKPKLASLGKNVSGGSRSSNNIPNIFLIVAVLAFVGSFSFALTQTQTSTNTRASAANEQVPNNLELKNSPFAKNANYPKSYNGVEIPQTIYAEAEQKYQNVQNKVEVKQYIIDQVQKYYVYKDLLAQTDDQPVTFALIESQVPSLENQVLISYVSSASFRYMFASFDELPMEKDVLNKYSSKQNIRNRAKAILDSYKSKLDQNPSSYNDIFEQAIVDPELILLNNDADFIDIQDYTKDGDFLSYVNLFDDKRKFNNFVFEQTQNKSSDLYTLHVNNKEYAYLFVFPYKMTINQYESLSALFDDKKSSFTY